MHVYRTVVLRGRGDDALHVRDEGSRSTHSAYDRPARVARPPHLLAQHGYARRRVERVRPPLDAVRVDPQRDDVAAPAHRVCEQQRPGEGLEGSDVSRAREPDGCRGDVRVVRDAVGAMQVEDADVVAVRDDEEPVPPAGGHAVRTCTSRAHSEVSAHDLTHRSGTARRRRTRARTRREA